VQTVSSKGNLVKYVLKLSKTMECGESVEFRLSNAALLSALPPATMKYGLSFIDAVGNPDGSVTVKIENRFGRKCVEGKNVKERRS